MENQTKHRLFNTNLKIDLKTILISGLIIYLFFSGFFDKYKTKTTIKTVTKTELIKNLDSLLNNRLATYPAKKVNVAINPNNEVRTLHKNKPPLQQNEKLLKLNEVKDTLHLKNATIFSTMLTDGKIYSHHAIAETNDKIVTTTTETKTTIPESATFINIEPILNLKGKLYGGEISIDRTYKNKIRLGLGAGYNDRLPIGEKAYAKIKFGIKF